MLNRRFKERVPSALSIGPAEVRGYRMAFHKRGADGSGKATLQHTGQSEDRVPGVLFRIDRDELPGLDGIEGGYERALRPVIARSGHSVDAFLYVALPASLRPGLEPFDWYVQLVVHGARQHRLPPEHVLWIECQNTQPDPDGERRARALALLGVP